MRKLFLVISILIISSCQSDVEVIKTLSFKIGSDTFDLEGDAYRYADYLNDEKVGISY